MLGTTGLGSMRRLSDRSVKLNTGGGGVECAFAPPVGRRDAGKKFGRQLDEAI